MKFPIRRWIAVAGAVAVALAASGAMVSAQGTAKQGSGWGGEGRAGSGAEAFLVRWMNSDWAALVGGTFTRSTNEQKEPAGPKNSTTTYGVSLLLRKAWTTGAVHPFVSAGPAYYHSHYEAEEFNGGVIIGPANSSTANGFGGNGELGAYVPVMSALLFGLLVNLDATRRSSSGVIVGLANRYSAMRLRAISPHVCITRPNARDATGRII